MISSADVQIIITDNDGRSTQIPDRDLLDNVDQCPTTLDLHSPIVAGTVEKEGDFFLENYSSQPVVVVEQRRPKATSRKARKKVRPCNYDDDPSSAGLFLPNQLSSTCFKLQQNLSATTRRSSTSWLIDGSALKKKFAKFLHWSSAPSASRVDDFSSFSSNLTRRLLPAGKQPKQHQEQQRHSDYGIVNSCPALVIGREKFFAPAPRCSLVVSTSVAEGPQYYYDHFSSSSSSDDGESPPSYLLDRRGEESSCSCSTSTPGVSLLPADASCCTSFINNNRRSSLDAVKRDNEPLVTLANSGASWDKCHPQKATLLSVVDPTTSNVVTCAVTACTPTNEYDGGESSSYQSKPIRGLSPPCTLALSGVSYLQVPAPAMIANNRGHHQNGSTPGMMPSPCRSARNIFNGAGTGNSSIAYRNGAVTPELSCPPTPNFSAARYFQPSLYGSTDLLPDDRKNSYVLYAGDETPPMDSRWSYGGQWLRL